ncbi:ATPase [Rhodobacteraceae bacterium WD3A24]|nr:ATPase [Rhodobacteraceae bacterium WD3A24]
MTSALEIYVDYFGLNQRPFTLVPDPDFLFWSPAHRAAYAMLDYGLLTRAPITLLTGEIGVGKTTLVHHFLRRLDDDVRVGMIASARPGGGELLRWVLPALGLTAESGASEAELHDRFQKFLIDEYTEGRHVVLIIDEAQNLTRDGLEQLRMLTNINTNKDELLQLVLVGQPELRETVRRPELIQFAQRIAANYHIPAMDAPTVLAYIGHRLTVAGGSPELFSKPAAELIQAATGGVPRLVNQLCDLSLTYAYSAGQRRVKRDTVLQVLDDGVFFAGGAVIPVELTE